MAFPKWAFGRKRRFAGKASGRRKRHIPGEMNKAEALFAETLEARQDVLSWEFERWTITLADGCKLTPDFRCLVEKDGSIHTVFYEVKAQWNKRMKRKSGTVKVRKPHWEDDARVKFKMAAELHPEYYWIGVSRNQDGTYQEEIFGGAE